MAQKRFGPTLDAGTVVIEKEGEKTIQASQLGSSAMVGILERGTVGELITAVGKRDLLAKTGGLIPDSLLPDAAQDFWEHSEGAGILFLYRVTDGTEVTAELTLYDRSEPRNAVAKVRAHNAGGWAGRRDNYVLDLASTGDITSETTVDLPVGFHPIQKDQFKGGTLYVTGANKSYEILSNDASDGVAKTTLTLTADSKVLTDYGVSSDLEVAIVLDQTDVWGRERKLAVEILDGEIDPSTSWGMKVYVNDELVRAYPDLSSDPNSKDYYVEIINEDTANVYVEVEDLWVGTVSADNRPANFFKAVADSEITTTGLDLSDVVVEVDSSNAGSNTIGTFTFGTSFIPDTLRVTYDSVGGDWTVVSLDKQANHTFPDATGGVAYVADNQWGIGFTITENTPLDGEYFDLKVNALPVDELINGRIFFPDESFAPGVGWLVTDNTRNSVSITTGDMTNAGAVSGNVNVRLQWPQQLGGGYDGVAALGDADFTAAFDTDSSPFNDTSGQGYGLIKFACPGIQELSGPDAVTVQKAGVSYCTAKNHMFRHEFPAAYTDEVVAKTYVNSTLGRSDHSKITFPSYAKVSDPVLTGRLKTVSLSGMIMGREAKVARDYDGYHKVAAGLSVTLPNVKELPTKERKLNGEVLNPVGIQRIEKKQGNFVLWGARIPSASTEWRFVQHRELMSHYEQILLSSFDYVIFAINDKQEWPGLIATLKAFFLPEWRKRALRGDTFAEAAQLKIDEENNTNLTMAAGDLNAEIKLRLADTVERFIITISKAGIFESLSA